MAEDKMRKILDDFLNRLIHKDLTSDILNGVKDEDLEQTVVDNILTKMNKSLSNENEVVRSLSKSQKAIYVTWILEGEVNNGGFNQFYHNSSGQLADLAEEAFGTIGATKFAELIRQSNAIYNSIKVKLENDDTYEDNPLNDLDDKFYGLYKEERLSQIKIKYIRENIRDFIID